MMFTKTLVTITNTFNEFKITNIPPFDMLNESAEIFISISESKFEFYFIPTYFIR